MPPISTPAPLSAAEVQKQMAANSAAWKTATPQMQTQLHDQNLGLAKQTGQSYNAAQGTYSAPTVPTPQTASPSGGYSPSGGGMWGAAAGAANMGKTAMPGAAAGAMAGMPSTSTNGVTPPPMPAEIKQAPATPMPAPSNGLYQDQYARSRDDIASLAKARIDKILQAGRTSAQGALTGAKNAYDYSQQTTQGNRALLQFDNSNRGDQFGGSAREDKFRLDRQQGIEDTATNNQYTAQVGFINQKLADLEAAAPGDEQAIIDQLQQIERTTGINVAQLQMQQQGQQQTQANADRTFNYNTGQDKITNERNATNDSFKNNLDVAKYNLDTAKYGLDVKKQHIDLANKLTELFGVKVNPTADPMQSYAQVAGLSTTAAQKIAQDAKQSTFDNAVKLALANNTITQTQANIMHQAQQIGISQQNANTSAANSGNTASNNQQNQLMAVWKATGKAPAGIPNVAEGTQYATAADGKLSTAEGYSSYTDGVAKYATNQKTGTKDLNNPNDVEAAILQSNLPESEMKKLYTRYGLKWGG
jgi:hypothetical protein